MLRKCGTETECSSGLGYPIPLKSGRGDPAPTILLRILHFLFTGANEFKSKN